MPSSSFLARKLARGAILDGGDIARLDGIVRSTRRIAAQEDLIAEGDEPRYVHVVEEGIACRYKHLPDGRRAIVALLVPGDFCDLHIAILGRMDHSIGALTDCEVSLIAADKLKEMLEKYPSINHACLWATLVDEAVLREWLVNVGRRPSVQALAHLFCELYMRLDVVGLTRDHHFRMPFTQTTLGDLLGVSQVHVQRTVSELRDLGLIVLQDRYVKIPDFDALAEFGEFDAAYLHLDRQRG